MKTKEKRLQAELGEKAQFLACQANDTTIRFAVLYSGRLQPDLLRRAVVQLAEQVEILHARFWAGAFRAGWTVEEGDCEQVFRLCRVGEDLEAQAQAAMLEPILWDSGLQMRCTLLENTERSALVLTVGHLCADGIDARYLLEKLVELYNSMLLYGKTDGVTIKNGTRQLEQCCGALTVTDRLHLYRRPAGGGAATEYVFPDGDPVERESDGPERLSAWALAVSQTMRQYGAPLDRELLAEIGRESIIKTKQEGRGAKAEAPERTQPACRSSAAETEQRAEGAERARLICHELSAARMKEARWYAKRYGATVNDLLLAAYYRAAARQLKLPAGTPMGIQSMLDLRRHVPGGDSLGVCNLSGSLPTRLESGTAGAFTDTLREVAAQTRRSKQDPLAGLYDFPLLSQLFRLLPFSAIRTLGARAYGKAAMSLTNLGAMREEKLAAGGLAPTAVRFAGPVKRKPALQLAAAGLNGAVCLCAALRCTDRDEQAVRELLELLDEELQEFCRQESRREGDGPALKA